MLQELSLENFKAFGKRTTFDLAPITLIFGENSAGKSTILQSLNLLKQTYDSGQSGAALLPRVEGGFVELGSYHELIFDHDASKKLRIGLSADSQRNFPFLQHQNYGLEISFRRVKKTGQILVSELAVNCGEMKEPIAKYRIRKSTRQEQNEFRRYSRFAVVSRRTGRPTLAFVAECKSISDNASFWSPIYEEWFARRKDVAKHLRLAMSRAHEIAEPDTSNASRKRTKATYQKAIDFYSQTFELDSFIERIRDSGIGQIMLMDGFLPLPGPMSALWKECPELEFVYRSRAAKRFKTTFDIGSFAFSSSRNISVALDAMFPMGPFRRPPERWYIFTGSSPVDVGYKGDHLPDLLYQKPQLVKKANDWLSKLDIGYRLKVNPVGDKKHSDLFEVRLVDNRRDGEIEVALSDVGFGISQILPFLVQSLSSENRIISIEQPEVHIHPRLQADLGDLIAEGIGKPHSHQYLIETHSEHLILRIQKLVRTKKLKPSDVSVLYVSRGSNGSEVERLHLDEDGDFKNDWPGGFFSERLRELR